MNKFTLTPDHIYGFTAGYLAGLGAAVAIAINMVNEADRQNKRSMALARETIKETWVYLPLDVKNKLQDSMKFYNITVAEDL